MSTSETVAKLPESVVNALVPRTDDTDTKVQEQTSTQPTQASREAGAKETTPKRPRSEKQSAQFQQCAERRLEMARKRAEAKRAIEDRARDILSKRLGAPVEAALPKARGRLSTEQQILHDELKELKQKISQGEEIDSEDDGDVILTALTNRLVKSLKKRNRQDPEEEEESESEGEMPEPEPRAPVRSQPLGAAPPRPTTIPRHTRQPYRPPTQSTQPPREQPREQPRQPEPSRPQAKTENVRPKFVMLG